jgi:uncharacterized damage-inducible protein DinB
MARYNIWQNASLYGCADRLADAERRLERGAFFGSIHGTLSHLLWGDRIWMHRFAGTPAPGGGIRQSPAAIADWAELKRARAAMDRTIAEWAERLDDAWLAADLVYWSQAAGREIVKPRALLVAHMFNHQTHHRGQVHCMLTQCGQKPDDTDLPLMPA